MSQKTDQIRQLEPSEIKQKADSLEKELYDLRYKAATAKLEKPHRLKELQKEIARCKTILKEKESANVSRR